MKEVKPPVDKKAEARAILEKERQERVDRASKAIQDILAKEECDMAISMIITPQGNIPQVNIVPKNE